MEARQVVQWEAESGDGRAEFAGVMRTMPVVVVKEEREACCALVGVGVGVSVSPFAQRGLHEAFGFAVGLGSVGSGEAVLEAQSSDGGAQGMGAVSDAVS